MTDPTPGYYAPQPNPYSTQSGYVAPQPYAPPPYNPATKTNGLAIASLITALLGVSIVGVVLGHIALVQVKKRQEEGAVLATIGLIFGYLGCLAWLAFWAYVAFTVVYAYGISN